MLNSLLQGLDRWIAANRPAYCALLKPGASLAALKA
jgi:hypothetical protein